LKISRALRLEKKDFYDRVRIRLKKCVDYARDADCLANFKAAAAIFRVLEEFGMPVDITTPKGVAIFYQVQKLLRRLNLYSKGVKPENETIRDTFLDASNYLDLEKECLLDEQGDGEEEV